MNGIRRPRRLDRYEQVMCAFEMAYVEGLTFNVNGIAARCGMSPNRHFRSTLNRLVEKRLLACHRVLYADGHYRKVYSSQARLPGFEHVGGKRK